MSQHSTHVGMDSHMKDIVVAMLLPCTEKPQEWTVPNEPQAIRRFAKKLKREAVGEIVCVYEAGPCGYGLQRQLVAQKIDCKVIAPSLIPVKPGERIKTNRRDARKLAFASRAGLLTEVHPPSREEEAARDLCRCREDAKEDLTRSRHRLSKFLLRQERVYRVGRNWTQAHRRWLRQQAFEHAASQAVFDEYLAVVEQLEERKKGLEHKIEQVAQEEPYRERVGWLRCFRGIDTVTALTILTELHGFERFDSPRGLMAFLGLVPSESSTGDKSRRGSITKTGNSHARRLLVEASWHYRHRPAVGIKLRQRREGQPTAIVSLADRAQQRLNRRFYRLVLSRGKPSQVAVVALARELAGFLWAALYLYPKMESQKAR